MKESTKHEIKKAEEQGWNFNWTDAGCHVTPPTVWYAWDHDPIEVLEQALKAQRELQ